MLVFTRPDEWSQLRKHYFGNPHSVGFVPTMGALHDGHRSLMERAAKENTISVCSIFVNPTQFDKAEDLEKYPRTLHDDLSAAEAAGCDVAFVPSVEAMYGDKVKSRVADYGHLTATLEGAHRPGHFDGVVTIVGKLFDAVRPDRAYFGEKDFQQLAIIRAFVEHEHRSEHIVPCALIRDRDGLALSSRNVRLTPTARQNALAIPHTLREMQKRREQLDPKALERWGQRHLEQQPGVELEYLSVVNAETFKQPEDWSEPVRALVAAHVGGVRLIDNVALT